MPELLKTKYHRDGSVTFWNVFTRSWVRAHNLQNQELATLTAKERRRVVRHFLAHPAPKE